MRNPQFAYPAGCASATTWSFGALCAALPQRSHTVYMHMRPGATQGQANPTVPKQNAQPSATSVHSLQGSQESEDMPATHHATAGATATVPRQRNHTGIGPSSNLGAKSASGGLGLTRCRDTTVSASAGGLNSPSRACLAGMGKCRVFLTLTSHRPLQFRGKQGSRMLLPQRRVNSLLPVLRPGPEGN